jgi:hypothetical protein
MNRNLYRRNKIVSEFVKKFSHRYEVNSINSEIISTYDGTYPSITINYENNESKLNSNQLRESKNELIESIKKYTNLIHGNDYWLSCKTL